jgi:lysophospholipase L1-like esterase
MSKSGWRYATFLCAATLLLMEGGSAVYLAAQHEGARAFTSHPPLFNPWALGNGKSRNMQLLDAVQGEYFDYDPTLGVRFRPGSRAYGMGYDAKADVMRYMPEMALQIDAQGLVPNADAPEPAERFAERLRAKDTLVVLVSGGSTAAGWGASGNSATWPAVLERLLNESLATAPSRWKQAIVVNSGVFGYNITQEIHRFQDETRYLEADIVICFNGINEQHGFEGPVAQFSFGQAQQRLLQESRQVARPAWMPFTRRAINVLATPARTTKPPSSGLTMKGNDEELFLDKARQFQAAVGLTGASFVHILQPIMGIGERKHTSLEDAMLRCYFTEEDQKATYMEKMSGFYEGVRSGLTASWQADFSTALDAAPETVYADPRHYNDHGQQLLAEKIHDLLREKGLL